MQQYGTHFIAGTKGNTAGLSRFDSITGLNVFHNLYAKSSNVFAAMPSLHSAYPLIVVYFGLQKKVSPVTTFLFATVMLGIWFAAIYTSHHYVLDVLAGIAAALLGIFVFKKILLKAGWFRYFLQTFLERLV
jgi:membrane-associated phospholipid phosphatase